MPIDKEILLKLVMAAKKLAVEGVKDMSNGRPMYSEYEAGPIAASLVEAALRQDKTGVEVRQALLSDK